jgi:hypothetical protein
MITNVSILTDPAYFVPPSCHCGILALRSCDIWEITLTVKHVFGLFTWKTWKWKVIDKYVAKRIIHMTPLSQSVLLWKLLLKGATKSRSQFSQIFDRVKSVALWSANIRKLAKDHKGYGSAAIPTHEIFKYLSKYILQLQWPSQTTF